jgi:hypothetical protein
MQKKSTGCGSGVRRGAEPNPRMERPWPSSTCIAADLTICAFVGIRGLLGAGHAAHSQWADASGARRIADVIVT